MVAVDTFVVNENEEVCLIKRADTHLWALPGGCHDLNETPVKAAVREYYEETGLAIEVTELLGVFSSNLYKYILYPYKDNQFCHILFRGRLIGGEEKTSKETLEIKWFRKNDLDNIAEGHLKRILFAFDKLANSDLPPHFE